ncbi:MAG: hypothetical protein L3J94_04790 [Gammaproteobacteria bacterium]|nr:hypothetical protein [Gammaproteobacteria bacterium]
MGEKNHKRIMEVIYAFEIGGSGRLAAAIAEKISQLGGQCLYLPSMAKMARFTPSWRKAIFPVMAWAVALFLPWS